MKRIYFTLLLLIGFACTSLMAQAPADSLKTNDSFKETIASIQAAIDSFDINQFYENMSEDFQKTKPSDEEVEKMKQSLSEMFAKLESIDFSKAQDSLQSFFKELEETFDGIESNQEKPAKENDPKLNKI